MIEPELFASTEGNKPEECLRITLNVVRKRFATQVNEGLLEELRQIATEERRPFHELVEEALCDLLIKRKGAAVREEVQKALEASTSELAEVYRRL